MPAIPLFSILFHQLGNGDRCNTNCRAPFTPLTRLRPGQQYFLISGDATKCCTLRSRNMTSPVSLAPIVSLALIQTQER